MVVRGCAAARGETVRGGVRGRQRKKGDACAPMRGQKVRNHATTWMMRPSERGARARCAPAQSEADHCCSRSSRTPDSLRPPTNIVVARAVPSRSDGGASHPGLFRPESIRAAGPQQAPPNPLVMERFQGVISQLFQQRIVRLGGAVDDDMANLIVAQLLYLDASDPKTDVTVYINSPGGSVTAGMAVFDTMRHIRPDVSTVCVGLAASMGAFLLASGEKGKRYSLPNSRIMIHQPLGGTQGQAADIEIQANEILHHKLTLNGYLSEFTGQPMDVITKDTDRDFFMSGEEAKEYGLVDGVVMRPGITLPPRNLKDIVDKGKHTNTHSHIRTCRALPPTNKHTQVRTRTSSLASAPAHTNTPLPLFSLSSPFLSFFFSFLFSSLLPGMKNPYAMSIYDAVDQADGSDPSPAI